MILDTQGAAISGFFRKVTALGLGLESWALFSVFYLVWMASGVAIRSFWIRIFFHVGSYFLLPSYSNNPILNGEL